MDRLGGEDGEEFSPSVKLFVNISGEGDMTS